MLAGADATAAPRRGARLLWARGEGADACVGVTGLSEDVKARLGWSPFTLAPEIEIEGTARRTEKGFRADLTFRDASGKSLGSRRLESREKDCRSLGEAVAVAITVAIDPDASGDAAPLAEERPPEDEPPPAPPPPPPPRENAPRLRASTFGGVGAGLVPGAGTMVGLRAAVIFADRVEAGLGATYLPETTEGAYGFGMALAEARGCYAPWGARGLLRFCGAFLAGAFETYVHTDTLTPVDVGVFPWVGAEAGPVLSIAVVGPVRAELGATAVVPIVRRQGLVRGQAAPVWEQSAVGGRADLGVGVLF